MRKTTDISGQVGGNDSSFFNSTSKSQFDTIQTFKIAMGQSKAHYIKIQIQAVKRTTSKPTKLEKKAITAGSK